MVSGNRMLPQLLVVCGMPRSGTRHFVNVLNAHPRIALTGEIPIPVMRQLFNLCDTVESQYRQNEKYSVNWNDKRYRFFLESIFSISKSARQIDPCSTDYRYAGTKTPNHEFLFEEYERFSARLDAQPVYVFCARNPESCWASYRSMPWARQNLKEFIRRYVRSYQKLREIQNAVGERCVVANLDSLVRSADDADHLKRTLFDPLGLEFLDEHARRIGQLRNVNSTLAKTGKKPESLPDSDIRFIRRNRGVREILSEYFPES
jgi:hypothetical protein